MVFYLAAWEWRKNETKEEKLEGKGMTKTIENSYLNNKTAMLPFAFHKTKLFYLQV